MKRTIEIDDTLNERVESAIEDVKAELLRYLEENRPDELPDISNDLDFDGTVHQIVDGSVPVYTYEIKCTWFLHQSDLEQAYEDVGVGDNPLENDGMAAIYYLIDARVREWWDDNAKDLFMTWRERQEPRARAS